MFTYVDVNVRALVLARGRVFVSTLGTSNRHESFQQYDP